MDATTVAVDLAKDIFEVALANRGGCVFQRIRLTRRQFERFIDSLTPGTEVVMEGCGTALLGPAVSGAQSPCAFAAGPGGLPILCRDAGVLDSRRPAKHADMIRLKSNEAIQRRVFVPRGMESQLGPAKAGHYVRVGCR